MPIRKLPCLSVRSPWSWLLGFGVKLIENRDWKYLPAVRGAVAIHSGKTPWAFAHGAEQWVGEESSTPLEGWGSLPKGVLVGVAEVLGAYWVDDLPAGLAGRWDVGGPVCIHMQAKFLLRDPRPISGALGFFSVAIDDAELIPVPPVRLGTSLVSMARGAWPHLTLPSDGLFG